MFQFNINSKTKILLPTNYPKYPFLIVGEQDNTGRTMYCLLKADGTPTGDGFYKEELTTYLPKFDMSLIE